MPSRPGGIAGDREIGAGMSLDQKRARVFGVLFLITFVTSIPALALYQPVLDHPVGYIAGAGHDGQILFAALLELLLIIANLGTAVVIFPIVRRQNEELALGYVTARAIECTFILVGILSVLGIITLRNQVAGAAEGTVAYTLAGIKDWTFLLGPGWVVGWGNGLILGYLMYRSQLVPRGACWLGLIGGPLLISTRPPLPFPRHDPSAPRASLAGPPAERRAAFSARHRDHPGVPVGTLPRRLLHLQGLQAVVADPPDRHSRRPPRGSARRRTGLETASCRSARHAIAPLPHFNRRQRHT